MASWFNFSRQAIIIIYVTIVTVFSVSLFAQSPAKKMSKDFKKVEAVIGTIESDYLGKRETEESISNLKAWKNIKNGILKVSFAFRGPRCPSCRFLVRLFDQNGNYLTHII